jgi:hypothetical protein
VMMLIFSHMTGTDLTRACLVCKRFVSVQHT